MSGADTAHAVGIVVARGGQVNSDAGEPGARSRKAANPDTIADAWPLLRNCSKVRPDDAR